MGESYTMSGEDRPEAYTESLHLQCLKSDTNEQPFERKAFSPYLNSKTQNEPLLHYEDPKASKSKRKS